jgi:hypothetical protein
MNNNHWAAGQCLSETTNTDPDALSRSPEDNTDPDALSRFPEELFDGGALDCDVNSSDLTIHADSASSRVFLKEADAEYELNALATADGSEREKRGPDGSGREKRGPTVKGAPFQGVTRNTSKVRLFAFHRIAAHR